jgi:GAF domain-containing protein
MLCGSPTAAIRMPAAALPPDEHSRLAMLEALGILDTPPEDDYDDIVAIAAASCGVPTATISLVDAHRQWFKARIGMAEPQTPRDRSFCAHAILSPGDLLVVDDAREDARFADNPLVLGGDIRFYAGAPLVVAGTAADQAGKAARA